jgi:transcriptional regulator with XRE-family HTH domain
MSGVVWAVDPDVIERARIVRGWTRGRLAVVAHVDPGTVSDLIAGRRRPTFGTITALCTVLGLELKDVISFVASDRAA